jgi:hypothetical protein
MAATEAQPTAARAAALRNAAFRARALRHLARDLRQDKISNLHTARILEDHANQIEQEARQQ